MNKIRISAVKYANTYPFIYGLNESGFNIRAIIETDHPADCATKLINGRVDIGLIPVAALPQLQKYHIISDYCIGAAGRVRTVMLLSNCPFVDIKTIYLDYRSLSSINLTKVLAKYSWQKGFNWKNTSKGFDFINIGLHEAVVLIGDQCFEYEKRFSFRIDLAEEWNKYTGLPFAFACWTANKKLDNGFLNDFNNALALGVNNTPAVVEKYGKTGFIKGEDLKIYLTENMSYDLNEDKKKAIKLFLELMGKL
jgi:chorismate dehydratase